jgi:hypothetical protein
VLLDEVRTLLLETLPEDPTAALLVAVWSLSGEEPEDESLVSKLKDANERLVDAVESTRYHAGTMGNLYSDFVLSWIRRLQSEPLVGHPSPIASLALISLSRDNIFRKS